MSDIHITLAQELDRYAEHRRAATAAAKAKRMWPDVIGDVLAEEITTMMDLPSWLQSRTRTQRLIDAILNATEAREDTAARTMATTITTADPAERIRTTPAAGTVATPSGSSAGTAAPPALTDGLRSSRTKPPPGSTAG